MRGPWLHELSTMAHDLLDSGVHLRGICLYPIIDRLLGGVGATQNPAQPTAHGAKSQSQDDPDVQTYDFRRPHRVSKERSPVLPCEPLNGLLTFGLGVPVVCGKP